MKGALLLTILCSFGAGFESVFLLAGLVTPGGAAACFLCGGGALVGAGLVWKALEGSATE